MSDENKSIKIVATISNYGAAANIGGDVEKKTYLIDEIPITSLPVEVRRHFLDKDHQKWQTFSLSILEV